MEGVFKISDSFFIETIDSDADETYERFRLILLDGEGNYVDVYLKLREAIELADILIKHITYTYSRLYYKILERIESYQKEYEDKIKKIKDSRMTESDKERRIMYVQTEYERLINEERQELTRYDTIIKKYTVNNKVK